MWATTKSRSIKYSHFSFLWKNPSFFRYKKNCCLLDLCGGNVSGKTGNNLDAILKPWYSLHVAVHKLKQIEQQATLARSIENCKIIVGCLCNAQTRPHFCSQPSHFYRLTVHLSGNTVSGARGKAGVVIVLNVRVERTFLNWTLVNSSLRAVRSGLVT